MFFRLRFVNQVSIVVANQIRYEHFRIKVNQYADFAGYDLSGSIAKLLLQTTFTNLKRKLKKLLLFDV